MKKFIKPIILILLLIFIIYISYNYIFIKCLNKSRFEKTTIELSKTYKNSPFSISKITTFSSAYGENKNTSFQENNWILDILQYTDIAIQINNNSKDELISSNSVKKLSINNINISQVSLGKPAFYYLDSQNFGTELFNDNYLISNELEYTVLNDSNTENTMQYNTPVFFSDCSNPITLKYVNNDIKENYNVTTNDAIFFNGKLLQMANIELSDISTNISFTINITNYDNQTFSYTVSLPINLTNKNSSIYDGYFTTEKNFENYKFVKNPAK